MLRSVSFEGTVAPLLSHVRGEAQRCPVVAPQMHTSDVDAMASQARCTANKRRGPSPEAPDGPSAAYKKSKAEACPPIALHLADRTYFAPAEFAALHDAMCSEGQPLVFVQDSSAGAVKELYELAAAHYASFDNDDASLAELLKLDVYFYAGPSDPDLKACPLAAIIGEDGEDLELLDALLGVNDRLGVSCVETHARQYRIAAMFCAGLFGFCDLAAAARLLEFGLHGNHHQAAKNAALLHLNGAQGASVAAHLLAWGAHPDARDPDDDFSVLGSAVHRRDETMIRLLLQAGADPHLETDTDASPYALIAFERYQHLAPLFASVPAPAR